MSKSIEEFRGTLENFKLGDGSYFNPEELEGLAKLFDQELAKRVEKAKAGERLHFANQMLGNDEWNIPSEVPDRPLLTDRLLEILEEEVAILNNQTKEVK